MRPSGGRPSKSISEKKLAYYLRSCYIFFPLEGRTSMHTSTARTENDRRKRRKPDNPAPAASSRLKKGSGKCGNPLRCRFYRCFCGAVPGSLRLAERCGNHTTSSILRRSHRVLIGIALAEIAEIP